ncbi:37S ribosomal protein MRP17, mitochondrial [Golovinomyces cichoracearum]|uniref:Small ribosomal subunit protein bS6m n=1 Tax=Golovinomyces cichoracearum TaxID=62708 RepID=A0A420IGR2_9PEZI|nr:37S ribosomal protein MRP17, mitochondrial [Golovinomyces cichoracearum]RKF73703.1 37S ribosomal protein MRP17, mitochondrial [Golovinomyces cichoracearum]
MLYELIAIVRAGAIDEVKDLARTAGSIVLKNGGIIRGLNNWGVFSLPRKVHKNQAIHSEGHYFIMRFDSSSKTQQEVRNTLGLDPRMIRFSSVKLGDGTLNKTSRIGGSIPWLEAEKF